MRGAVAAVPYHDESFHRFARVVTQAEQAVPRFGLCWVERTLPTTHARHDYGLEIQGRPATIMNVQCEE